MTVALIMLAVFAVAVVIALGLCGAAKAGDRRLLDDDDTREFPAVPEPTPAQRAAAWDADDPAELRRAAGEWRRIGATDYAASLEAQAAGEEHPTVARPW